MPLSHALNSAKKPMDYLGLVPLGLTSGFVGSPIGAKPLKDPTPSMRSASRALVQARDSGDRPGAFAHSFTTRWRSTAWARKYSTVRCASLGVGLQPPS